MKEKKYKENITVLGVLAWIGIVVAVVMVIDTPNESMKKHYKELQVKNIKLFNKHVSMICSTSHLSKENYLVSVKNDWSIFNNEYFKKGDLLLSIDKCISVQEDKRGE